MSFSGLFKSEAAGGLVLLFAALVALALVNLGDASAYEQALATPLGPLSLHGWINDGLMAFFFFTVGLEIKAEWMDGALASFDRAALPVAGALGGMIVPVLVFLSFQTSRAWGIPMATDIAFAVGVLALFGRRVPSELKVFLLALAIADDLGAVTVIALVYTSQIHFQFLAAALALFGATAMIAKFVRPQSATLGQIRAAVLIALGVSVWWYTHLSGVHATIAGCALGFLVPHPNSWLKPLHGLSSFVVMPLFALANAGLSFQSPVGSAADPTQALMDAISYGLFIGKPLGIFTACFCAVKLRVARFEGRWRDLFAVSCLGGIGFTMSLFIASLALDAETLEFAKRGVVKGSLLSAFVGSALLLFVLRGDSKQTRPLETPLR